MYFLSARRTPDSGAVGNTSGTAGAGCGLSGGGGSRSAQGATSGDPPGVDGLDCDVPIYFPSKYPLLRSANLTPEFIVSCGMASIRALS